MAITSIYLVRHAHAVWQNDEARALSRSGRKAARALATLLADHPISAIYSSPFRRSVETVEPLADRVGLRQILVPDLRERALPVVPLEEFDRQVHDAWRNPDRAVPGGESNVSAQARGLAVMKRVLTEKAGLHAVVATHGNLLTLVLNGLDPAFGYDFWRGLSFPDVYRIELDEMQLRSVERLWRGA
jgi:2,3-bisphosphoglycerate-dependent phosphoglycerate mutase